MNYEAGINFFRRKTGNLQRKKYWIKTKTLDLTQTISGALKQFSNRETDPAIRNEDGTFTFSDFTKVDSGFNKFFVTEVHKHRQFERNPYKKTPLGLIGERSIRRNQRP